jgi:hypothetical protein
MFHKIFNDRRNGALAGSGCRILALTIGLALAATGIGAATAHAQAHKKMPDRWYRVTLQYRGSTAAELTVTDANRDNSVVLRKRMENGEKATIRVFATTTRPTQSAPEARMRWKVSRIVDPSSPAKPEDALKSTRCGDREISENNADILVGFEGEVIGRSC